MGNNRLTFCDFNNNGRIEISDDPGTQENELEITQETHYYPFGLEHKGNWYATVTPDNNYLYNGKELNRDYDINLYEYGARWYDPAIGRFIGVDPIADQFAWVSVYNYAENEPVGSIDLHGLQKVSVNDIRNADGKITQRNVTVSANMKVLNLSSKDNYQFNSSLSRAGEKATRSFSSSFDARVLDSPETGLTSKEIPISIKFNLSVKQVSSIDQVSNTDFVSIIVDNIDTDVSTDAEGVAQKDNNVSLLEAGSMTGNSPEVLLHELGHNLGLGHTPDGKGLMGEKVNGQTSVGEGDLKGMLMGLGVGGRSNQRKYSNTKENAINFLKNNTGKYDKNKAKKAGI